MKSSLQTRHSFVTDVFITVIAVIPTCLPSAGHLFYCLAEAPKPEVSETASRSSKTPALSVNGGDSRKSSAAVATKLTRKSSAATKVVFLSPMELIFPWGLKFLKGWCGLSSVVSEISTWDYF